MPPLGTVSSTEAGKLTCTVYLVTTIHVNLKREKTERTVVYICLGGWGRGRGLFVFPYGALCGLFGWNCALPLRVYRIFTNLG